MLGLGFRLKTGFYETKLFDLLISKGKLVLSRSESGDQVITIPEKDILSITLKSEKLLEIEIQTWDKTYQGILYNNTDYEKLLEQLKENINIKIIFELKGGN